LNLEEYKREIIEKKKNDIYLKCNPRIVYSYPKEVELANIED
jgi:hypothetical protein